MEMGYALSEPSLTAVRQEEKTVRLNRGPTRLCLTELDTAYCSLISSS